MFKRINPKSPVFLVCFASASFLTVNFLSYLEGRTNCTPILLEIMMPFLFMALSSVVLFVHLMRSIVLRRPFIPISLMFMFSVVLLIGFFKIPPIRFYVSGFQNYVTHVLTADEWRDIARFAQTNIVNDHILPGPGKNLWEENKHRELWSKLSASTHIKSLPDTLVIRTWQGNTIISWGGALPGHRGITIYSNANAAGKPYFLQTTNDFKRIHSYIEIRIADDMEVGHGP